MLQLPSNAGFMQEAVREPTVFGSLRTQFLEGHFAVEVAVVSEPDAADAPGGMQARQRVAPPREWTARSASGFRSRSERSTLGRRYASERSRTVEWGSVGGRGGSGQERRGGARRSGEAG